MLFLFGCLVESTVGEKPHKQKGPPKHGFWNPPCFWALDPVCRILVFMWSVGPLLYVKGFGSDPPAGQKAL